MQYQPDQREKLHWTQTLSMGGNPYALKPKPEMLLEGGCVVMRSYCPLGRNAKKGAKPTFYDVTYDASYVHSYIYENVLRRFPGIKHDQARALLVGALKLRKDKVGEANKTTS